MSISTHPELITIIILGSKAIGGPVLLDVAGHPEEKSLRKLLTEQNKIGGTSSSWDSGLGHGERFK